MERLLNLEYAGTHGGYWMIYGVVCSFASVFLLDKGYSNSDIGVILAAGSIAAVFMQPLLADIADRSKKISLIGITEIVTVVIAVMTAITFVTAKASAALSVIFVMMVAWVTAMQPLVNSLAFKLAESGHYVNFGVARSMGSLAYSILCAFLGTLAEKYGVTVLPAAGEIILAFLFVVLFATSKHFKRALTENAENSMPYGKTAAAGSSAEESDSFDGELPKTTGKPLAIAVEYPKTAGEAARTAAELPGTAENRFDAARGDENPEAKTAGQTKKPEKSEASGDCAASEDINLLQFVKRNKMFLIVSLGVGGIFFSNSVFNNFMLQIVEGVGGDSEDMGRVFSLMAFCEIPPMFFFSRVRRRFSSETLLKFAAVCFTAKVVWAYMAQNVAMIFIAQVFQIVSFGVFMPGMVCFIDEIMEKGEAVKGQALYTIMITVSTVFASFAGGFILDLGGASALLLIASAVTGAGALLFIAFVGKIKKRKK